MPINICQDIECKKKKKKEILINPSPDVVNINASQNLVKFHQFVLKSWNEIPTSIKGHNSAINLWKFMRNNPNIDVFNINAYAKFGQIPSIISQDIKWKWNSYISQGP